MTYDTITTDGSGSHQAVLEPGLVFQHYWGGSSRTWQLVIGRLDGGPRCVALDQRGWAALLQRMDDTI